MKKITSVIFCFLVSMSVLPQTDSLKIVAFGNSTTAFRKGVEMVYSVRLQEKLAKTGICVHVVNSGVGSSHTGSIKDNDFAIVKHGMDRFKTDVLDLHPNWVIINFGLNDAYQDEGIQGKPRISLVKYRENLEYFIKTIKDQEGSVILLTPNPLGSKYELFRKNQVKKYANCVRDIAREQKVALVDSWELFNKYASETSGTRDIDFLFLDGIHPNDLGHELIADALSRLLIQAHP